MIRFLCALAVLAATGCGSSSKTTAPPIAMMMGDFDGRAGVDSGTAQIIRDAFSAELQKTKRFVIVDRKATSAILQEQEFQASQQGDAAKMPKLQSLKKMLSGSVGKLGDNFIFNIKMTDLETATVDFAIAKTFSGDLEDVVDDFLPQLAREVLQSVTRK